MTRLIYSNGLLNLLYVSDEILKALSPEGATNREDTKKQLANLKEHENIVSQYKDLIQEQVDKPLEYINFLTPTYLSGFKYFNEDLMLL